jgi:hypothetical protein
MLYNRWWQVFPFEKDRQQSMEEKEESDMRRIGGRSSQTRGSMETIGERELRERWQLKLQMEEQRMKHERETREEEAGGQVGGHRPARGVLKNP